VPYKDPIAAKEYDRRYREWYRPANRVRDTATRAEWREKNREHYNAFRRTWAKEHPESIRVSLQRCRARRDNAPGRGVALEEWFSSLADYSYRCAYCGAGGKMSMDHVDCIAKGGEHDVDNIVPACRSCNSKKHTTNLAVFLSKLAASRRIFLCVGTPNALPGVN
jgi:5-methylcytosine-specific restriction endonuclease McrA